MNGQPLSPAIVIVTMMAAIVPHLSIAQTAGTPLIPSRLRFEAALAIPIDGHRLTEGAHIGAEYQCGILPLIMATVAVGLDYLPSPSDEGYGPKSASMSGGQGVVFTAGAGLQVLGWNNGLPGDRAYPYVSVTGGAAITTIAERRIEGEAPKLLRSKVDEVSPLYGIGIGIAARPWDVMRFDGEIRFTRATVTQIHVSMGIGLGL